MVLSSRSFSKNKFFEEEIPAVFGGSPPSPIITKTILKLSRNFFSFPHSRYITASFSKVLKSKGIPRIVVIPLTRSLRHRMYIRYERLLLSKAILSLFPIKDQGQQKAACATLECPRNKNPLSFLFFLFFSRLSSTERITVTVPYLQELGNQTTRRVNETSRSRVVVFFRERKIREHLGWNERVVGSFLLRTTGWFPVEIAAWVIRASFFFFPLRGKPFSWNKIEASIFFII